MTKSKTDWFETWFDTPYYPILYKHRDEKEAELFMNNLLDYCQLPKNSHILDLGCGQGRHSIFLHKLGYQVTGIDLSKNRINAAKEYKAANIQFVQADMRTAFPEKYDAIFNLFTSFGYFLEEEDDLRILQNIKNSLTENGIVVIDFLNTLLATKNMVSNELKEIDNTHFTIDRYINNGFLMKEIQVGGKKYYERVKCLDLESIGRLVHQVGFRIIDTFGDYHLNPFDVKKSPRLIIVLKAETIRLNNSQFD